MNILAIDTSGWGIGLAIGRDHKDCLSVRRKTRTADERLLPELRRLLKRAGLKLSDIDGFAAGCGPGRFTGVRIGMVFTELLARSLGKPFVGVNRFEAWASVSDDPGGTTRKSTYKCVVFPAGRGDIYLQMFKIGRAGRHRPAGKPQFAREDEAEDALERLSRGKRVVVSRYDFKDAEFPGFPASFILSAARGKFRRRAREAYKPLYLRPAGYELKRDR